MPPSRLHAPPGRLRKERRGRERVARVAGWRRGQWGGRVVAVAAASHRVRHEREREKEREGKNKLGWVG
jgi:hypothetical protein